MLIRALLLATTAVLAVPIPAGAQTPGPAEPATVGDTPPQGVLIFTPDFFASSGPNTALDMIGRLPGFGLDSGDNDTRGFAGAAGNVLIDGDRPATKSEDLDAILRRISADSVERIELIRGGAPGIDMQGRAVIANVVLKRTVQIERVIEVNSYLYPDGYLGPLLKGSWSRREGDDQLEASFSAGADRTGQTATGYRRRFDAAGALTQDADLDLWDRYRSVEGTVAWQARVSGGKLRINALGNWFDMASSIDTHILSGFGSDELSTGDYSSANGEVGANWSRPLGERAEIELIGLQTYETEDSLSGSRTASGGADFGSDSTSGESIARAVLRFRPNDRWAWEGGGEAAYNFLDSTTTYAENGVPVPLPSASVRVEELRGEAFGQATWRPRASLTVEAALRVEVSEIRQSGDSDRSRTFVYPKPRVQLTWTPIPDHQIRLRLEREVGQLDFEDFVASADVDLNQVEGGNPELEPEKSWVVEGVYERRFWGEGVLTLTASHRKWEDIVDVIPLVGGFEAVGNVGTGTSDFQQVQLALPLDRFGLANARFHARYSWNQSSVIDPLTGEARRFSSQLANGCGVSFDQDLRGGRWSYGGHHGCNLDDSFQYRIREVRRLETDPDLTFFVQWKPRPELTLRFDAGNASDLERRRTRFVYSGPRNSSPLAFREDRGTRQGPFVFLQARRTF
ncbi:TonB-dependent receptor plug domain-containing protein [Brevundimonas subvibrioides]|uniref:TonB-dependent receptor plug domain-containing protein n=1 Tax=Brevundimonas subvibrioides TaxID=74313 RepID=UPI0022B37D07|nr:TonB-dependent receptor [Brevundimonas subvibrioides]